jgi:hypothetical protein
MSYIPETMWQITDDGKLVYNLKSSTWKSGKPCMENDVTVSVKAPTEELRVEVAKLICNTLNTHYPDKDSDVAVDAAIDKFEELHRNDPLISAILMSGGTDIDYVVELAAQRDHLYKRVAELQAIAPFKVRTPDGKTLIWHCPDEFVPERNLQKPEE